MKSFKTRELGTIGKIVISSEIEQLIDSMHNEVGALEWSGILFYKLIKGNICELKDLVFEATFLYPMNIGSHSYTEFEYNGEIMDAYDMKSDLINCSTGLLHTHHSMSTFFSGDDKEELFGNCGNYNYYLSLIVNFSKSYSCKLAIPSTVKTKYEYAFKGTDGKLVKSIRTVEEETIAVGDLSIEFENYVEIPEWIEKRVKVLEERKKAAAEAAKKKAARTNLKTYTPHSSYPTKSYNDYDSMYGWVWEDEQPLLPTVTIKEFLTALILLDSNGKDSMNISVEGAINTILIQEELSSDDYDIAISNNIEIIHRALYGNDNFINTHCQMAVKELEKYENLFTGNEYYYTILIENLELYAATTV